MLILMKRYLYWLTLCFLIVITGCSKEETPVYKIGVSQCSHDEWREKMNEEMRREMLFHDDSILEIISANDNNEKQISDIQSFIDRGFDLLIVSPNEAAVLTPIVKKAYEMGIPVIIFDRRVQGNDFTTYIDLDNESIGNAAAQYAYSIFGDKETDIIEITGLGGSTPAMERHQGFKEGLDAHPNLKLKATVDGKWDRERAIALADSLLSLYPDIKLVYAHSDNMAIGISELFKGKGKTDIKILGTDASPGQGIEAVRDGIIDASFIYPTEGHRIIKTAFAILEGQPYEKEVNIPSLSSVDKSNAEILLRQNELLKDETSKVLMLDEINDQQEVRYRNLTRFSNTILVLAIVLVLVLFMIVMLFIRNRKLQKELENQNKKLIAERDKQIQLYQHLDDVLVKENDFYSRFVNILKTQFADSSISTESLAQQLDLGPAQLTRKIKSLTNFTPVELLRNYRLEEARKLLLSTNNTINEITSAVGFSSAAYFTKCFREHFGMTPTDLRSNRANS